ncbi:MAG TPA: hypothetical protein VFD41_13335 [Actinomycetales bacterium]|nr:hypothetical protein [Actinomycetales bacterium]
MVAVDVTEPFDRDPQRLVVRGVVTEGVEPGSVVLVPDPGGPGSATYQLGPAWQHVIGRRVDLVAQALPRMMTTQQQGTPVRVLSLTIVDG